MADRQPPERGGGRDPQGPGRRLGGGDLIKFAGALLASLGIGRLVDRWRKHPSMSESNPKPQRRVTGASRRDPVVGPPRSDVEEELRAKAEEDALIEAKRALGHEPSGVRVSPLAWISVAIVAILLLTLGGLYGLFSFLQSQPPAAQPPSALGGAQPTPPGPRLQTDPVADWQDLRGTEEANLSSYGWADQKAGKVRIPIDRAIELLAQRGLPVAPGATRQFGGDRTPNLDSSGGREPTGTPAPVVTPTASP
jgi:hypothetical protein